MRVDDPFGDLTRQPRLPAQASDGGRAQWTQWQQECETPLLPGAWQVAELQGEWRQYRVDVVIDPHAEANSARRALAALQSPRSVGALDAVREQLSHLLPPASRLSDAEVASALQARQFAARRPGLGLWEIEPPREEPAERDLRLCR